MNANPYERRSAPAHMGTTVAFTWERAILYTALRGKSYLARVGSLCLRIRSDPDQDDICECGPQRNIWKDGIQMSFLLFLCASGHRDLVQNAVRVTVWPIIEKSPVGGPSGPCLL